MNRVLIGCDPEFVIIKGRHSVSMCQIIKDDHKDNKIGLDMGRKVVELRPDPSDDIFVLVAHIRHLLKTIVDSRKGLKKCKFIAGHYAGDEPLGGHIHISCSSLRENNKLHAEDFTRFLDTIIGNGLMYTVNDMEAHNNRNDCDYGHLGDSRVGNSGSLEYRTPPSWLVSPSLAFMFLGLAKICAIIYLNPSDYSRKVVTEATDYDGENGRPYLHKVLQIAKHRHAMMKMPDVVKCIELIEGVKRNTKHSWNVDFKPNWEI